MSVRTRRRKETTSVRNQRRLQTLAHHILEKSSQCDFASRKEEWANYLDLNRLVDQVVDLQKDVPMPVDCGGSVLCSSRLSLVARLRSWLLDQGARIGAVEAVTLPDQLGDRERAQEHGERGEGRREAVGLRCCRSISRGESVVEIPRCAMLILDSPDTDCPLDCVLSGDKVVESLPQLRLALILLGQCLLPLVNTPAAQTSAETTASGGVSHQTSGGCTGSGGVSYKTSGGCIGSGVVSHQTIGGCTGSDGVSHEASGDCSGNGEVSHQASGGCSGSGGVSHQASGGCTGSGGASHHTSGGCICSGVVSRWRPYLQCLPREYDTPLYFTPHELRGLAPSVTLDEVVKQYRHIVRQYSHFYLLIAKCSDSSVRRLLPHFTYKLFRWCVSTVMTRMNQIPSVRDSNSYVPALIPFWDLCNHCSGELSTDYDPELGRSCCFAFRDFQPGQEFCIYYGARSNSQFFLHNGFVYEDNTEDSVQLILGVSSSDRLRLLRLQLLKLAGVQGGRLWTVYHRHRLEDCLQSQLVAFCRVHVMDQETVEWWLDHGDSASALNSPSHPVEPLVSVDCERAAWRFLHTRLSLLLKAYSDGGAPDGGKGNYSARAELVRRLCRTECRVLEHVQNLVADRLLQM